MATHIVWFRRDLRLQDHQALFQALHTCKGKGDHLLAVFHIHPKLTDSFTLRHDYFYESLHHHVNQCLEYKMPIHFIYGEIEEAFETLTDTIPAIKTVYFNKDETPFALKRDEEVTTFLQKKGIEVYSYVDHHLHGANEIVKQDGSHYKVFTPYYKQWRSELKPKAATIDLALLSRYALDQRTQFSKGQAVYATLMQQKTGKWTQASGSAAAQKQLSHFIRDGIDDYKGDRDFPAINGTSRLSGYLRTGAISVRDVFYTILDHIHENGESEGSETFIQELAWRDFYNMIYYYYPESKDKEVKEKYRTLDWNDNEHHFELWKEGKTGYPLIDAAMIQLKQEGWMHNRLRMVVASFLTKDLQINWRLGERYFEEMLIDYDPASNIGGWQWAASTGTDAVPYFRIFNPERQSERFDPDGTFIKTYLNALKNVPLKYIHNPSAMTEDEQQEIGCLIGTDYPAKIVDHHHMRKKTLALFDDM